MKTKLIVAAIALSLTNVSVSHASILDIFTIQISKPKPIRPAISKPKPIRPAISKPKPIRPKFAS